DGKAKARPTHYAGSVRIRSFDPAPAQGGQEPPLNVQLEVSTEPRLQVQAVTSSRITKAVDDNGQSLTQDTSFEDAQDGVIVAPGGARALVLRRERMLAAPYGLGSVRHTVVSLKKGEKTSTSLKELTGTITLQALDVPEAMITVENVLKAAGTTTKGKSGGQIKIVDATKTKEGHIKLQVEVESPPNVTPARGAGFAVGGMVATPPIRVNVAAPALVPPPAPVPAEKPKDKPADKPKEAPAKEDKGEDKKQAKEKQQAAPPPAAPGAPAVAVGPVALAERPNFGGTNFQGLSLVDDKGKCFPITGVGIAAQAVAGGQVSTTYELTFEVKKDQGEPAKLIFSGS